MSKQINPNVGSGAGPSAGQLGQGQVLYQMNPTSPSLSGVAASSIKPGSQNQQQNTASQAQASALINQAAVKQQQFQQQQYQQRMAQDYQTSAAASGFYPKQFNNFQLMNPGPTAMQNPAGHHVGINVGAPIFHSSNINGLSPYEGLQRQQAMMQQQNSSVSSQNDNAPSMGGAPSANSGFHPHQIGGSQVMMGAPASKQFGAYPSGTDDMQPQGQMFNGMIISGAPQGLMSNQSEGQAYNHKLFMGGVNQQQIGASNQVTPSSVGNTGANNMQNDLQPNYQMNVQMNNGQSSLMGQGGLGVENRNALGVSNAISTTVSDIGTVDGRPPSSISMQSGFTNFSTNTQEGKKFDVLKTYEKATSGQTFKSLDYSIFYGGIDTGIDIGELYTPSLETELMSAQHQGKISQNHTLQNLQQSHKKYADRFIGPFCRTTLNSPKMLEFYPTIQQQQTDAPQTGIQGIFAELSQSEQQQQKLMQKYFNLINQNSHIQVNGPPDFQQSPEYLVDTKTKAESESFYHDFILPKCYDMPNFRSDSSQGGSSKSSPIALDRCKQFPDSVLFYIFYSMPQDKAQLNVSHELKSRSWFYSNQSMRWMKAVSVPVAQQKQSSKNQNVKKGRNNSKNTTTRGKSNGQNGVNNSPSQRSVIVFNPQTWREETLSILED